jgi:PqqD family protein of HPr-rel-A system
VVSGEAGVRLWSWARGALHSVHLGDEIVAFHEATASTHVFDADTYQLVETLRQAVGAVTSAALWRAAFGEPPAESDCQALEERLERLQQSGLVTATNT